MCGRAAGGQGGWCFSFFPLIPPQAGISANPGLSLLATAVAFFAEISPPD